MATKRELESMVTKLGGIVDVENNLISVWSPPGYVWAATGDHVISRLAGNRSNNWRGEAHADLIAEVKDGLLPCTFTDCEFCE